MKSIKFKVAILFFVLSYNSFAQIVENGYSNKLSYRANDPVTFYLQLASSSFINPADLSISPVGGPSMATLFNVTLFFQTVNPNEPWKNGFNYLPTVTWNVPISLRSGYYLLDHIVPIIIKDPNYPSTADIVIVIPTNTINAYTTSGGKSLYQNLTGIPNNNQNDYRATAVSFQRPVFRQEQFDDFRGFLQWFYFAYPNANVNVISDQDMDDYNEIANAKLIIIPGHSEYWSRQARLNFDKFVDAGKDALILSGCTKDERNKDITSGTKKNYH